MAHPSGSNGNDFETNHGFAEAFNFIGENGLAFTSTTGEQINASRELAQDGVTEVILFMGERLRHGSVCNACWGFRKDCNGSYIGQCAEALDDLIA